MILKTQVLQVALSPIHSATSHRVTNISLVAGLLVPSRTQAQQLTYKTLSTMALAAPQTPCLAHASIAEATSRAITATLHSPIGTSMATGSKMPTTTLLCGPPAFLAHHRHSSATGLQTIACSSDGYSNKIMVVVPLLIM